MIYIKILSIATFIGSITWLVVSPGFEPGLALIGSISAIIYAFLIEGKKSKETEFSKGNQQSQSISKSSTGIQAGGDVNVVVNRSDQNDK